MIRLSKKHQQRALLVLALLLALSTAIGLTLYALKQNINLFFTPSDLVHNQVPVGQMIRMGGLVVPGSVQRSFHDLTVTFALTDTKNEVRIEYTGILPDLFREDQGIVVLGTWQDNFFLAQEVLAKHDENYMPAEVVEAIERSNQYETTP